MSGSKSKALKLLEKLSGSKRKISDSEPKTKSKPKPFSLADQNELESESFNQTAPSTPESSKKAKVELSVKPSTTKNIDNNPSPHNNDNNTSNNGKSKNNKSDKNISNNKHNDNADDDDDDQDDNSNNNNKHVPVPLAPAPSIVTGSNSGSVSVKGTNGSGSSSSGLVSSKKEEEEEKVTFSSLGVVESLCVACKSLKWLNPSPIQKDSLPYSLPRPGLKPGDPPIRGRDIIGLAETGSGKTGAFVLPILQGLLFQPQPLYALILAPTRELAFQISEQCEALGSTIGVKSCVIVGGVDIMDQAIALARKPHIIVATPGRIVDHLQNTKGFHLRELKYFVLDEADRLLDMDFEKEIDTILQVIPDSKTRSTLLFSATMTTKVQKLQRASLSNPVRVEVSSKYQTVSGLIQNYLFIPAKLKEVYLTYILNELSGQSTIIFAATCEATKKLSLMLRSLGFHCLPLHGKLSQQQRLASLHKFKAAQHLDKVIQSKSSSATTIINSGQTSCNILICTDVASRGLDIPAVDLVINYDIPTHSKDYIHRVGRTARAGRSGKAITIVTQYDVELFQRIEQLIGLKMNLFPCEKDAVMILSDRVNEACRYAAMELREQEQSLSNGKNKNEAAGSNENNEEDEFSKGAILNKFKNKHAAAFKGKNNPKGKRGMGKGRR